MSTEPEVFDEWLDRLPNLSFTDFGGWCDVSRVRDGTLYNVRRLVREERHSDLIRRLTKAVELAVPRTID